jgi:hypothetical protein
VKNSWGKDWGFYNGTWNDKSIFWTPLKKAQVPYVNADDGIFFIEDLDFIGAFSTFDISLYDPSR